MTPCDTHQYEYAYATTSVRVGFQQFKKEILSYGGPKMQNLTSIVASWAKAWVIKNMKIKTTITQQSMMFIHSILGTVYKKILEVQYI
jgi:hypothetical protein